MPDAFTSLSDLHLPESAAAIVQEAAVGKSRFFNSGAVTDVSSVVQVNPSALQVVLPFWKTPDAELQLLSEGVNLEVKKVSGGKQVSPVLGRAAVFGNTDLSAIFSGADPVAALLGQMGDQFAREYDRVCVASAAGFLATTESGGSMAGNVLDVSAASGNAAKFDAAVAVDATALLGDDLDSLNIVIMHPQIYAKALKDDLIAFIQPSDGGQQIPTYQGKAVVVTGRATTAGSGASTVYNTIFCASGAFGFASGSHPNELETDRRALTGGGQSIAIGRRVFVLHPFGAQWIGDPSADTASNAELATGTNWKRVYEAQNVRLVVLKSKV
jgi:hypothetical protein